MNQLIDAVFFSNLRGFLIENYSERTAETLIPKDVLSSLVSRNAAEFREAMGSLEFGSAKQPGGAKRKKQCEKGWSCGNTCIARKRSCRSPLSGQAKTYADWMATRTKQVKKAQSRYDANSLTVARDSSKTINNGSTQIETENWKFSTKTGGRSASVQVEKTIDRKIGTRYFILGANGQAVSSAKTLEDAKTKALEQIAKQETA
ncbi:MAG: hypothetical protein HC781_21580 [Leptolyngbyaceae cyanobacterium CSU_1_4]|nr:hypothetical protein [Leptolyngbyaceae cyanobacterium CSU_1_4]